MHTRRSLRKATKAASSEATKTHQPALEDARYRLLEIAALSTAAQGLTTIPAAGTREHDLVVAKLVCLVDMLTTLSNTALHEVDLRLGIASL